MEYFQFRIIKGIIRNNPFKAIILNKTSTTESMRKQSLQVPVTRSLVIVYSILPVYIERLTTMTVLCGIRRRDCCGTGIPVSSWNSS